MKITILTIFPEMFTPLHASILGRAERGEVFAETYACVPGAKLMISAVAAQPCEILFLETSRVLHICSNACEFHSRLILNLLQVMAAKTLAFHKKLEITAKMEEEYLKKYYRIPLASTTGPHMLSSQVYYYTEDYNIMYGYGGIRLMTYNYDDAAWEAYIAEQGGTLSYE